VSCFRAVASAFIAILSGIDCRLNGKKNGGVQLIRSNDNTISQALHLPWRYTLLSQVTPTTATTKVYRCAIVLHRFTSYCVALSNSSTRMWIRTLSIVFAPESTRLFPASFIFSKKLIPSICSPAPQAYIQELRRLRWKKIDNVQLEFCGAGSGRE